MTSIGICRSLVVGRLKFRMYSVNHTYEDAVSKLNSLQSNKATIQQIQRDIQTGKKCTNLEDMENYLLRTGVTLSNLDQLSVIHVAGTKGKGSTCVMCESILRRHGYRTGFYSSPHLVAVRERIRLDGQVIAKDKFTEHFQKVYNMLEATQEYEGDMPRYFTFLTVMAYHVFLEEKVDVAIVEVGIGGQHDVTNVIRKVPVVGIAAMGLDHTSILGNTLPQIAAAKAGIMKPGCEAFTVPQPPHVMVVLRTVARDVKCTLNVVPNYNTYTFPNSYKTKLQVNIEASQTNASLAIQLAHAWMRSTRFQHSRKRNALRKMIMKQNISEKIIIQNGCEDLLGPYVKEDKSLSGDGMVSQIPKETAIGLKECRWPGRYHVVETSYAEIYLDGAHTKESMEICAKWFSDNNKTKDKILIFGATGDRDPVVLLGPLTQIDFQQIYFVIPTAHPCTAKHSDNYSAVEHEDQLARCHRNAAAWEQISGGHGARTLVLDSVAAALGRVERRPRPAVLVTGSLHLVGHTLAILDPLLTT